MITRRLRLRELREARFLTQANLAARAGLTQATVSRLEQGRHEPSLATIKKLARALGVRPETLVREDG